MEQGEKVQMTDDFFNLEKPYELRIRKEEGERNIAHIASIEEVEHIWAYSNETSMWRFYPPHQFESYSEEKGIGHIQLGATIPQELESPLDRTSILYHTHPISIINKLEKAMDGREMHTREFLLVSNQLPKGEDLQACACMVDNGYVEFCVVTPLGVTRVYFHREKVENAQFSNLEINESEINNNLAIGFDYAVEKCLERMEEHYSGVFTFKYEGFDNPPIS